MEAQGYTVDTNILFEDNTSAILLVTNGRQSAGKKSKHIKNKYFIIANKVAQGDIQIQHEGTNTMWANYHLKPPHGKNFRVMRSKLMDYQVEYNDDVKRQITPPLLLPKVEAGTEVVDVVKNTIKTAVVK